jgi:myo-inositol-1(or 4)-monophosphatase
MSNRSSVDRFETMVRLARQAGAMARERFPRAHAGWKADGSMVTDADLLIQDWLIAEIAVAFPDDGVLGEEGPTPAAWRTDARHVWVLDPIDGTNNFGRGIPGFAVSIGILDGGRPHAGAVYDPLADQLFAACVGQGAWLNGGPLRVTAQPLSARSLFSVRAPFEASVPPFVAGWLRRYRLRRHGSTALSLCYVAAGALAFVHDHGASLWDVAGAAPVVLEAGAVLTGADGTALFPVDPGRYLGRRLALLAGDPLAHAATRSDVTSARRRRHGARRAFGHRSGGLGAGAGNVTPPSSSRHAGRRRSNA